MGHILAPFAGRCLCIEKKPSIKKRNSHMSTTSSWDQLKKVREEEYFLKEEREKIAALKAQRAKSLEFLTETKEKMKTFERGFSPLRGMSMFRANIAGDL